MIDKIKSVYKAVICEHESGKIDILYECDVNKNKECSKKNCGYSGCMHTLDREYAKNFKDEIETKIPPIKSQS